MDVYTFPLQVHPVSALGDLIMPNKIWLLFSYLPRVVIILIYITKHYKTNTKPQEKPLQNIQQ